MEEFRNRVTTKYRVAINEYEELWRWSVKNISSFWEEVWEYCDIIHSRRYQSVWLTHDDDDDDYGRCIAM